MVRFPGQPQNVFSIVVDWDGYSSVLKKERDGAFKIIRVFQYDRSREAKFIQAIAENTVRYQNARSVRQTANVDAVIRAVTNVLVPVYK
jgi:hypothetical protein